MKHPARCSHGVILCDACARALVTTVTPTETEVRARLVALEKVNADLRERVRGLENRLAEAGDENYDLKQRFRQLEVVNQELRSLQNGRRG